jgi:hypothetical protein
MPALGCAQLIQCFLSIYDFLNDPFSPREVAAECEAYCGLVFDNEGAAFAAPCRLRRYVVVQNPESAEPSGDSRSFSKARSRI